MTRPSLVGVLAVAILAGCARTEDQAQPEAQEAPGATVALRQVVLFFEGDRGLLVPESRALPLPQDDAAALHPLASAWIDGSERTPGLRPFPPDTTVRGAFVLPGGTAVIDLGGETLQEGWDTGTRTEMLAAYGLVQTAVANLGSVERVQILVGGEVAPTLGGHLDLSRPLRPAAWLVESGAPTRSPAAAGTANP